MRRTRAGWGLTGAGLLLLSGIGTAGEIAGPSDFQSELRPVTRTGPVGMEVARVPRASRSPRRAPGTPSAQIDPRPTPDRPGLERRSPEGRLPAGAPHAPLPVPEMPFHRPEADAAMALDTSPLPTPVPSLGLNFEALPDNGLALPPDTHGAVGPTKLMTVLNTEVRVQERNGTEVSTVSLDSFWSSVRTAAVFDPRVLYDPDPNYGQGRWIWAAVQGARTAASGFLIAASTNEEPGLGYGYFVDVDLGNALWADYPTLGFNKNWVVLQVNLFKILDDSFYQTNIYVFDKAELYTGTVGGATLFYSTLMGGTQVPAATYDYTVDDLYLLQRWSAAGGALRLYRIYDNAGTPDLESAVGYPTIADPWADTAPGGVDFAPQVDGPPGCVAAPCAPNCRIQTNDSRIQNVVYRAGTLWATHTVFYPEAAPTRSSVQWWQIDTDATVRQQGLVDDPLDQRFYAFPSIAVNRHGDMLLGYSSFEGGDFAGARYSFRNAYDEANRLRSEAPLKNGESCYYKAANGRNRWGDYSATVVDALDDTRLWTIQEYAAAPGAEDRWGTWWGAVETARTLSIADASVSEGDAGPTSLDFTIALSEPTTQTVTVQWSTADDTATVTDGDYVAVSSTLVTFDPGEKEKTVTVTVNGDAKHEADETLFVNLTSPTGATVADGQAQGTILDDEPAPQIAIGDVALLEGDSGTTAFVFPVTLSYASTLSVQVSWGTGTVTATPGVDYVSASGFVSFLPGEVAHTITVFVNGDTGLESDEFFTVALTSPSGGTLVKSLGTGTIVDDDATTPGVRGLVAVSDSSAGQGRNRLQWVNPAGGNPSGLRIDWTEGGSPCVSYPATAAAGVPVTLGTPGLPQTWEHTGLTLGSYYCYSVWVEHTPGGYSLAATATGKPFSSTGAVKWKYITGATMIPPATVGLDGILAPSNDFMVHSMERGPTGGQWPPSWSPISLGSPAQKRSPIVPIAGINRAYFTTQDGRVHSVDAKTGALLWSTQLSPGAAEAAPAGIFSAWGGAGDYILVGTALANNNFFYALDPFTGAVIDRFPQAGDPVSDLGPVYSAAAVDYASGLVYFASFGTAANPETLWCLRLGPTHDALSLEWKKEDESGTPLGNITGSPTLRGNRLYVGNDAGTVWAVETSTGSPAYDYVTSDPGPIDFVWPDRSSTALYFSTANNVWGIQDSTSALSNLWTAPSIFLTGSNPSTVLLWPGQPYLYVGLESLPPPSGQPGLLQIDVTLPDPNSNLRYRPLETDPVVIGPPSLDIGNGNNLIHVGSEAGILYAVQVPLP